MRADTPVRTLSDMTPRDGSHSSAADQRRFVVRRHGVPFIWAVTLSIALLAWASAQQPFTRGNEVVVTTDTLNVREAPGLDATRVGSVSYGARGFVIDSSPYWSDGYWWWRVQFRNGPEGWVADGDPTEAYIGDANDRELLDALDPSGKSGPWTQADFDAALERGLPLRCDHGERWHHANTFMGAPFPTQRCPEGEVVAFHRFDDPDLWDLEDPRVRLLGHHDADVARVYFVSWSLSAIRGTGGFSELNVYVQPSGETPYLAYTISTQGEAYDPARPAEVMASTELHLPEDANCCPSFFIEQVFRADARGLSLVERRTVLNEHGGLARRMTEASTLAGSARAPEPSMVSAIATEVAAIALDETLTPGQRHERVTRLQGRWDAELLATAVRLMPVYDADSGGWRSFDRWAREAAHETGVDAPFTADPVGSTVRMLFDPSVSTISDQLGLPDALSW